jgi:DNA-binding LytR/AlgR family response regulator
MVEVFGDPEQCVEIAQAALAFLDIGFDKIAGVAGLAVAFVALGRAWR